MRDALSIFDRVVSFSGDKLTRKAVSENLNVLDYDVFFKATDLMLNNQIPELLLLFNEILGQGFEGRHFISGLASHFRDLYVAKSPVTTTLLDTGPSVHEKYITQSSNTNSDFLSQALSLANECDLNYRGSRNQRLLVEICLMKLASINFDGEKKKTDQSIIPAAYFPNKPKTFSNKQEKHHSPQQTHNSPKALEAPIKADVSTSAEPVSTTAKTAVLPTAKRQTSGLSLKSIQRKKEHQIKQMNVALVQEEMPKDLFTQPQLLAVWEQYVENLESKGHYNMAAILKIDTPKLINNTLIALEFPNSTNKIEVERQQTELLKFLRKSLNNFDIKLDITVNETMEKKFAYTTAEKYAKLKEKNPAIESLKKSFNLEI